MTIQRKSHNLDADLLDRARRVIGAQTETDTIHEALRAVLVGEEIVQDLEAARSAKGRRAADLFRPEFVRAMRAGRRTPR